MNPAAVVCPNCQGALTSALCNTPAPVACPACDATIRVEVFPAFFRGVASGHAGEIIIEDGVASCYYHERKKAVVPCDGCGRFLCALCDLEMDGKHFCPACLQAGKAKGRMPQLENRRTLYDSSALTLSLAPLILFWPLTLVTAPLALYLAIISFFRPSSVIPRTRFRAYLAIVLALAQMSGWGLLFFGVWPFR